jgi:hypothetical protein
MVVTKGSHRATEQEAELRERHRRDLVLSEVLVDELGEGRPPRHPALAPETLQHALERRPRVLLGPEATALHALRVAPSGSVPIGPETLPVWAAGSQLEHLALLQHPAHSFQSESKPSVVMRAGGVRPVAHQGAPRRPLNAGQRGASSLRRAAAGSQFAGVSRSRTPLPDYC